MSKHPTEISPLKAGAAYIGTVVGAGFATGQEILQFFTNFGAKGMWGIALSTFLFICFGYIIMSVGNSRSARSHLEVIDGTGGHLLTKFMDVLITFFLFGSLTAMIAGTGAIAREQLGVSAVWGSLFMTVLTTATVLYGIDGIINSISAVVPFLLLSIAGISGYCIIKAPPIYAEAQTAVQSGLISNWLTAAILYTSYNTVISISVLGPLGTKLSGKKAILKSAAIGGLGLGIGSAMIYAALLLNIGEAPRYEIPMLYLAGTPLIKALYTAVLTAEIYTTAIGSLYGFTARLTSGIISPRRGVPLTLAAAATAFFASFASFSGIVKILYPLIGLGGLLLLASLLHEQIPFLRRR